MSAPGRNHDDELQDYLDGRLSAEQRAAFEARLTRESALRAKLDGALEIREALGSEPPSLSTGFYTRARARFEASARRRPARWTFRLISWETAGVAAAAALVTALFVPWLMDEGVPTDLGSAAPESNYRIPAEQKLVRADDRDDGSDPGEVADAPALITDAERVARKSQTGAIRSEYELPEEAEIRSRVVVKRKLEDARASAGLERQQAEGAADWSPEPDDAARRDVAGKEAGDATLADTAAPRSRAGEKSREASPRPGRREAAEPRPDTPAAATEDRYELLQAESEVPSPPPPAERPAPAPASPAAPVQKQVGRVSIDERDAIQGNASAPLRQVSVELGSGLVEPGELLTIEDLSTWQGLLDGPHGAALRMLGAPGGDRRLVLIGPRESLDCDRLRLVRLGDEHQIRADAPGSDRAVAGCAVTLPRDRLPVSFVGIDDPAGSR